MPSSWGARPRWAGSEASTPTSTRCLDGSSDEVTTRGWSWRFHWAVILRASRLLAAASKEMSRVLAVARRSTRAAHEEPSGDVVAGGGHRVLVA